MKEEFSVGQRFALFVAALLGPVLIYLAGFTWRVRFVGQDKLDEARKIKGRVLFCFWHSRLLGLCYTHRYRNFGIMVSQSFDGEWIARIVTRLGYRVFRGSASRDGARALLEMLKDNSGDLALTVDGPRGPAEKVKPGAISLAAHSELPIVPISFTASRYWRLKSWDRLIIPKPFSLVTVKYGEMIRVGKHSDNPDKMLMLVENGICRLG
jgi:lysophospholipid acyltransferase (LPLAT)-like uncharacterized protein